MERRRHRPSYVSAFACAVLIGLAIMPGCGHDQPAPRRAPTAPVSKAPPSIAKQQSAATKPSIDRGEALYAQHCLACHGAKGDGKGLAAKFVFPQPRDFRAGRFRLVSTNNRVASVADIEQVLIRGMPGSAMISWAHLSEADRKLLSEHVLKLRRDGARDVELAIAKENEETLSEEDLVAAVERMTAASEVLQPPEAMPASSESIGRGALLFKGKGCASCHGDQGKGDGQQKMVDNEGLPTRPRDLTRGIFKGWPDYAAVYRRIWLGMPGSAMPGSQNLTPEEVSDLVHFVLSLSKPEVRDTAVLNRVKLTAARTAALPEAINDDSWKQVAAAPLRMTPLWWRDHESPDLQVQALHDGRAITLRISWKDAEPDLHGLRSEQFEDAVAVELYSGPNEPFVGMGARDATVDVWMWDADHYYGGADVEDANPRMVVDQYPLTETVVANAEFDRPGTKTTEQAKLSLPAVAAGNQIAFTSESGGAMALEGGGPGSVTFRLPRSQLVRSNAEWSNGRWNVMFTRELQVPGGQTGLSLAAGSQVSVAFAVWNGSQRDRNGQKLITIWQDLVLEK